MKSFLLLDNLSIATLLFCGGNSHFIVTLKQTQSIYEKDLFQDDDNKIENLQHSLTRKLKKPDQIKSMTSAGSALKDVDIGVQFTCVINPFGTVFCWGRNFGGNLGNSRNGDEFYVSSSLAPVNLGNRKAKNIYTSQSNACALLETNDVLCWGYGGSAVNGNGVSTHVGSSSSTMGDNLIPIDFGQGRKVFKMDCGLQHCCAILDDGNLKCWGANTSGQLGLGDTITRGNQPGQMGNNLPIVDVGDATIIDVSVGGMHTCILFDDGSAKCFGDNTSGQLGQGDQAARGDTMETLVKVIPSIDLGDTISKIFALSFHSCAILASGDLKCWGYNVHAEAGSGNMETYGDEPNEMGNNLPFVDLGEGIKAKTVDAHHITCVTTSNNKAKCWGQENNYCALGSTNTPGNVGDSPDEMGDKLPYMKLKSSAEVKNVRVGGNFACAHFTDRTLQCWGLNQYGELGLGNQFKRVGCLESEMGDSLRSIEVKVCDTQHVSLEMTTDSNPEGTSWYLKSLTSDTFLMKTRTGTYSLQQTNQYDLCEDYDTFEFQVEHQLGEWYGDYKLSVNSRVIKQASPEGYFYIDRVLFSACEVDTNCNDRDPCTSDVCNNDIGICTFTLFYSPSCRSFGNPSTLVIRGASLDSELSTPAQNLSDSFFGTYGNMFNMRSQFMACSYNQFNMTKYTGVTTSGQTVKDGVVDIQINEISNGKAAGYVAAKIYEMAELYLGDMTSQFDFVVICVPSGTLVGDSANWKAYAFIHSYLSIYNDFNCIYPSVQLHEIGHNLGLSHSNDEENYGDTSGNMGISYSSTLGPAKCFNSPKSFQLRWYRDSFIVMDVKDILNKEVQLVGLSDFENRGYKSTHFKIINCFNGFDYYISFNRNTTMNSGTTEGINEVLVTERKIGTFYQNSYLIAKLGHLQKFTIYNIGNGGYLNLHMIPNIYMETNISFARVSFTTWNSFCVNIEDCDDGNYCTTDSCINHEGEEVCSNTPKSCDECGSPVFVQLETNEYPHEIIWTIKNVLTDRISHSSPLYTEKYYLYNHSDCLEYGQYKFTLSYDGNNTHLNHSISYNITVGREIVDQGRITEVWTTESFFTICSSNSDCYDFDGCSIDYCNNETRLCYNTLVSSDEYCSSCSWFVLNIKMDNFADETSWKISDYNTDNLVFSGSPYPLELIGNGRRKAPTKSGRRKAPTRSSVKHKTNFATLNDDEEKVLKRICLQKNVKYSFLILDSFGDGICCAEGEGSYTISIGDKEVIRGGNFTTQEYSYFKFSSSSDDCEDQDLGMRYEFDTDTSTCFYYPIDCDEYGAMVNVLVQTDIYSDDTKWEITKEDRVMMDGGQFNLAFNQYEKKKCLPYGSYLFSINDSHSDGMAYCFDNACGYSLIVSNETIRESDGSFGFSRTHVFGICKSDDECNDKDECTSDHCDILNKICRFEKLPCSACNKETVSILVHTDFLFSLTSWSLSDETTSYIIGSDGPFVQKYFSYEQRFCLKDGFYSFTIKNSEGRGMTICKDDSCGYEISVNNKTIIESDGSFAYEYEEKFVICYYDYQCDDLDECTVDSCDFMTKTCHNIQLPCSECLKETVSIIIKTDGRSMETSWYISNSSDQHVLVSGGKYARNYTQYQEIYCLPTGHYTLKVLDSNGNGMTSCLERNETCGYSVTINNSTAIIGDGSFMFEKSHSFGICYTDDDCINDDFCTTHNCDTTINACENNLICSQCQKKKITVALSTDENSQETSWSISSVSDQSSLLSGGVFAQKLTTYSESYCISGGEYDITIFDISGNGLSSCTNSSCELTVKIDDALILNINGNFTHYETHHFLVNSEYTPFPTSELLSGLPTLSPTYVSTMKYASIIDFAVGYYHTCAVTSTGSVFCWGQNKYGQLGYGDTEDRNQTKFDLFPVSLGDRNAKKVYAGGFHTCVLLSSNDLVCFGLNEFGQLGSESKVNIGSSSGQMGENLQIVKLGTGRKIIKVSLGYLHSCVLLDNNGLKCFGKNDFGQLGYEHTGNIGSSAHDMGDNLNDVNIGNNVFIRDVSAGTSHTCVTLENGIKCFGDNSKGQLGYSDIQNRGEKLQTMGQHLPLIEIEEIEEISAGNSVTCIVTKSGKAKCIGYNVFGQLGTGDNIDIIGYDENSLFMDFGTGKLIHRMTKSSYSTCALLSDNSVKCFGWNLECSLGIGNNGHTLGSFTTGDELAAIDFGMHSVGDIKMTHWHVCALFTDGTLFCWGYNQFAQLGQNHYTNIGCKSDDMGSNIRPIQLYEPITWVIEFDSIISKNRTNHINLKYNVSKSLTNRQLISRVYDKTCIELLNDVLIITSDFKIEEKITQQLDEAILSIDLDYSRIKESDSWRQFSDTSGSLDFCIKSEILLNERSDVSVSFCETNLVLHYNFEGNFNITDISLKEKNKQNVSQKENLDLDTCICNQKQTCLENPTFYQNSDIMICVYPMKDTLQVKKFQSIFFYQDGILKYKAVENGEDSDLTTSLVEVMGMTKTRLISVFFDAPNPSNVYILGTVLLDYKKQRYLNEQNDDKILRSDIRTFKVELSLSKSQLCIPPVKLVLILLCIGIVVMRNLIRKRTYEGYERVMSREV